MRCTWCDSEESFYAGSWRTIDEILTEVESLDCPLVEVTGGEPLLQPGAIPLLRELCDRGLEVLLETGGGVDIAPVDSRVRRIVDIKCPGSGEAGNNRWENLDLLTGQDELKFVLADEGDYRWARDAVQQLELVEVCTVHFSPVFGDMNADDLAAWILRDGLSVRLQLQLHKLIWGTETSSI